MKITKWTEDHVYFSDGSYITYSHFQDCCEHHYADFSILEVMYHGEEFESYEIETVEKAGFILKLYQDNGDKLLGYTGYLNIFIPCYSEQNGYYTSLLDIHCYNKDGKLLWKDFLDCEMRLR